MGRRVGFGLLVDRRLWAVGWPRPEPRSESEGDPVDAEPDGEGDADDEAGENARGYGDAGFTRGRGASGEVALAMGPSSRMAAANVIPPSMGCGGEQENRLFSWQVVASSV
jgi:hypothetical protein